MDKLFLYLAVFLLLLSSVFAVSKSDFVQLVENTPYCFDCHTIYKVTKAADVPITNLKVDLYGKNKESVDKETGFSFLKYETYTEEVPVYEPCTKNVTRVLDNDTGESVTVAVEDSCFVRIDSVEKQRPFYQVISPENFMMIYNDAKIGDSFYVKISGNLRLGEAFDNVLSLGDYVYDEYAWWNASFAYRMKINCTLLDNGLPFVINGSNGFMINGSKQVIWTYCVGANTSLYYNSYSSYVVANDTNQSWMEVEYGNATSYYSDLVWSSYHNATYHMFNVSDSAGSNDLTVDAAATVVTGLFGNAMNFSGSSYYTMGPSVLSSTSDFSVLLWANPASLSSGTFSNKVGEFNFYGSGGKLFIDIYNAGWFNVCSLNANIGGWSMITLTWNESTSNASCYINATLNNSRAGTNIVSAGSGTLFIGSEDLGGNKVYSYIDEFRLMRKRLSSSEITQIYQNAIGTKGYGDLGSVEESLWSANESSAMTAILDGISISEIADSYSIYNDKQVFIRLANGSQYKSLFDRFVVSGNKRWAFNYDQNSSGGFVAFFNITPVFYVWQNYNLSYVVIKNAVRTLIDNTN
jgi:hypothetical protein